MASGTLNVSLSKEQSDQVAQEVRTGEYRSANEVVREALGERLNRRRKTNLAALEEAHAGAWERDTTSEELDAILQAQRRPRAKRSPGTSPPPPTRQAPPPSPRPPRIRSPA